MAGWGSNTQGNGVHPSDGALQPLGALAYLGPLCTNRDGERAGPQGAVFSSSDGHLHPQGPERKAPQKGARNETPKTTLKKLTCGGRANGGPGARGGKKQRASVGTYD